MQKDSRLDYLESKQNKTVSHSPCEYCIHLVLCISLSGTPTSRTHAATFHFTHVPHNSTVFIFISIQHTLSFPQISFVNFSVIKSAVNQ